MSRLIRNAWKPKRVILFAEGLEDRSLPSGNAVAVLNAGILNVVGDGAANKLVIAAVNETAVVITSLDGATTINGAAGPLQVNDVRALNVVMGGGNDFLHITGTRGNLVAFVDMGAGNDALAMTFATHEGMTSLNTGPGNDVVSLGCCEFEALTLINVGTGNNQVYIAGCQFDDSAIGGTGGSNQLSLLDVEFERDPLIFGFQSIGSLLMPRANDDNGGILLHGRAKTIDVAANDNAVTGTLNLASIQITTPPRNGTVRVNADGTVTYTADTSNVLSDSFGYTIRNSAGGVSNEATVSLILVPVDTTPPDTTAPVPSITTTAGSPTNQSPLPITVTFSEDVTGFGTGDILVTRGNVSNFTEVDARTYTFDVTPTTDGDVIITLPAGAAQDAAGNLSTSATLTVVADSTGPSVVISTPANNPTNLAVIPFTATFTEDVTGFGEVDIVVTNGALSNFLAVDARTYTFDVTPTAEGTVTVEIPADVASDLVGNLNFARTFSLVWDQTAPTAVVTTPDDPTSEDPIIFTVAFDEDVAGLPLAAVAAVNGTVGAITTVNAQTFTVEVAPTADGAVTLTVLSGQVQDLAGNATTADFSDSTTSDRTAPAVGIDTATSAAVTGTAADTTSAVTGVEVSIFDGASYWDGTGFTSALEVFHAASSSDNFATWSFAISATGTFTVHALATDSAGNVGEATDTVMVS